MALQDIYDKLNDALHDGVIAISATTVGGIDLTLEALGLTGASALGLTGATLTLGAQSVVLAGTATYRNFTWSTTLTGVSLSTTDPGDNEFSLSMQGLDATTPWTFGTSFHMLPQSRVADPNGTLPLTTSVLAPLVVDTPVLSVTTRPPRPEVPYPVRIQGWLVLTNSQLAPYMSYFVPFGAASTLRLDGTIAFTDPLVPVITARAAAPNAARNFPIVPVDEIGIKLQSHYEDIFSLEENAFLSAAAVYAQITIGRTQHVTAEVTTPLLQGDAVWPLAVSLQPPITASTGLNLVLEFFGQPPGSLDLISFPLAHTLFNSFGLSAVEVGVRPPLNNQAIGLTYASMAFKSTEEWRPSIAFITVKEIGTGWTYHWYGDTEFVTGNVWGRIVFFDDPTLDVAPLGDGCQTNKIEILVRADIPQFQILGRTESPICVPIGAVLKKYLGGSGGISDDLRISRIVFQAIPQQQTYQASMMIDGIWSVAVNNVTFSLDRLIGELMVTQNKVYGSVTGWASIVVTSGGIPTTKATFQAGAEYQRDGTWHFAGGLAEGTLNVVDFAFGLLGVQPAVTLPQINLKELWLEYTASGAGNPYSARGTLEVRWQPTVLGMTLSVEAKARVARRRKTSAADAARALASPRLADGEMIYEGAISGTVKVNSLAVTLGLSFVDKETVYFLEVAFREVAVRAATEWIDDRKAADPAGRHEIIVITLTGLTLGDVVEYFVNLANPNQNYHLGAPWSFLDAIDLSRFALKIDPKYQTISLTYAVNLTLPFASLKSVGVLYDGANGEGSVKFVLEGDFLGKRYSVAGGNPLAWDAVNDPPPQVPGAGGRLFELRYLGAGQHVSLRNPPRSSSVLDVLTELRREMQPPKSMGANPFADNAIEFDPNSDWMFGIDCTVMDTVRVGIILHDPDLYGLVIALAGPEAGALSGLSFELLYKKVTDDVGVFRVRLQVPDSFRQINLGYISITLAVITVDIFTNGNFKVDLGFPHNRDFSIAFSLEAGIFIGSGGIYFGLLDGATSSRVPAITNGTFSPVLELGIGLAVGVGRTFNKGALKAGLYVQLVAIFEGVLAWFHPNDESAPKAMYYWCQGSAGLIGKLYGTVDFKVIKVNVSVEAHAIVSITFAAHRETEVALDVGVSVEAEVTVLFVSVSFSFHLRLTASFTMGANSVAPWTLADDQSGRSPRRLLGNVAVPWRRQPIHVTELTRRAHLRERYGRAALRARLAGAPMAYDLNWPSEPVFPDGAVHPVAIKMLPAYAIDQVPVQWPQQPAPSNPTPAYRIAFLLMADNGVPPHAATIAEKQKLSPEHHASAVGTTDLSFNVLVEAMLRWSLAAIGLDPVSGLVTPGQLDELAAQLDRDEAYASLTMQALANFFARNLELRVSGVPSGTTPSQIGGTSFPIPPPLGWDSSTNPGDERRFATFQPVDSTYEAEVTKYFAGLNPDPSSTWPAASVRSDGDDTPESMATFIFRDYFLMLAKAAVQAAAQVMTAFPYRVTGADTEALASIASPFPTVTDEYTKRTGDTVDQVADFYGASRSEILALNPNLAAALDAAPPGSGVPVVLGVTPESLASANPAWPLRAGVSLALGDLAHQMRDGETFSSMAARFGADADAWLQDAGLLAQRDLLRTGAPLAVTQSSFVNSGSLPLASVAAVFYVRFRGTHHLGLVEDESIPMVEWYVQAIGDLNTIVGGVLPPVISVPKAFDDLTNPISWTTLPGDTLWTVAATVAVYQNQTGDEAFAAWLQAVSALNPGAGPFPRVNIPATQTPIVAGDTLAALAARLPVELRSGSAWLDRPASFRAMVKGAGILTPLAVVTVPGCRATTAGNQTIASLAVMYDLATEDLGRRVATAGGLLATGSAQFVVPHPPCARIGSSTATAADLVPAVLAGHASTIGGQVARFLVSGLRMGAPELKDGKYHPTGLMTGLYELVGQQIVGPAPPTSAPPPNPATSLVLTVKNFDATATWLQLYDSAAIDDTTALTGELLRLNPGLPHRRASRALHGLVALTAPVAQLTFTITDGDTHANYPAPVLQQTFTVAPGPRPLYRDVPVRHALQQQIRWQTTEAIPLPNPGGVTPPVNGMPSLWPFGNDLMRAELMFPAKTFALCTIDPQLGPGADPAELSLYAWATAIDVRIRTIPGLRNTYELFGADTAGRQLLLELWQYLQPRTDTATIHVLYQQSVSSGLPNGLSSTPVADAATYIVKTNLSTDTQSGLSGSAGVADPPTFGPYYARLADAAQFLSLLWECSVAGGGGYWLQYTAADGSPLPGSIFGSGGTGTLKLVVTLGSQMAAQPARVLHPYNNCALVGTSLDASASNLFAQVADKSETNRESTVAPGNVAFTTSLQKPPKNTYPVIDKQIAARQLYSLLAYQLTAAPTFNDSTFSMPVGPKVPESPGGVLDETTWDLFQVIPIWRYAKSYMLPSVAGLPSATLDPYAGINGATQDGKPVMASTNLKLWFQDVLGNASRATGQPSDGGPDGVLIPVGYTDPVIGLGAWPATTSFFHVTSPPTGSGAELMVTISLQAAAHLPGLLQRAADSAKAAAAHLTRFSDIWYQVSQPDVTCSLSTTLDMTDGKPTVLTTSGTLADFAAAACAWLGTASQLVDVFVDTTLTPTLQAVSSACGVGFDGLAIANAKVPLPNMFPEPPAQPVEGRDFTIPVYGTFKAHDTVAVLCPHGIDPIEVLKNRDNVSLPLHTAVELVIPAKSYRVPNDPPLPAAPMTLKQIAGANDVSVASLAAANATTGGLLRTDFVFTYENVDVIVQKEHPDVSLDDVAATFVSHGIQVDAVMVAGANADRPGMFRAGATLTVNRYLIVEGDTLAANGSGASLDALAHANATTVDLFFAGTAIYLTYAAAGTAFDNALEDAAGLFGLSGEQLLRHNAGVALKSVSAPPPGPARLAIPGHAAQPAAAGQASLRIPSAIQANATLAGIAALFVNADPSQPSAAMALALANLNMPRVLGGGKNISAGGQMVTTHADGDSFASLLQLFDPAVPLLDVVTAIQGTAGFLETGALLLTPPARLPAAKPAYSPNEVGALYGINIDDLASANSGLAGVVKAGVTLRSPDGGAAIIVTGAADTFVSFVWRFSQAGVHTTVAAVFATNADASFLAGGAAILLPPPPSVLSATFGANRWSFPSAIFDVHTWVQIARDYRLVDEHVRGDNHDGPAVLDLTSVPPVPKVYGGAPADEYLALQQFARDLQAAVPVVRAATGKMLSEQRESSPSDVWAAAFGPTYIQSIDVHPGVVVNGNTIPQYFALRPLENALIGRAGVAIKSLQPDGTLGPAVPTDFQGVDLEVWARRFLADLDLFGSAPYAAAAYRTPQRASLTSVLASKQALAGAIAQGLDYVLDLRQPDPSRVTPPPRDWAAACESLRQRLLVSLATGYDVDAIVQYQSAVASPWSGDVTRLSGPSTIADSGTGDERSATTSNAKTSLAATPASQPGFVDFLVDLAETGQGRTVDLDLAYRVNQIEFNVQEIVEGYDASDWLTFITPFNDTLPPGVAFTLGKADVPVPVRGYPPLPMLLGHRAQPTYAHPAKYDQAMRWDYVVTYQHQSMAVDQIRVEIELNQAPLDLEGFVPSEDHLFEKLAQYYAVAPQLWSILRGLPDYEKSTDKTTIEHAIATFAGLVADVAANWELHWTAGVARVRRKSSLARPKAQTYTFSQTLESRVDEVTKKAYYSALYLTRTPADADVAWPVMGVMVNGVVQTMGDGIDTPRGRKYDFPQGVEAFTLVAFEMRFAGLHVAACENASAQVQVVRNSSLTDIAPTRASFVYQTRWLAFPDVVVPLLSWQAPFPIAPWTWSAADNPLGPVFTTMFDGSAENRTISCGVRYGFVLATAPDASIVPYQPVKYRPQFPYVAGTASGSLPEIIAAAKEWYDREQPNTAGGQWLVSLALYSGVEGQADRPLLELSLSTSVGPS